MIRKTLPIALLLAAITIAVAAAATTTIKLATLVPDGSLWDKELRIMGSEWRQATEGRVKLNLYAGGVAGSDEDVVRKMRIGQLHAATLTVIGLVEIDEAFEVFSIPRFYSSYEELYHVVAALTPTIEQRLEAKGYVLLGWGHGGWAHLFSKKPVRLPKDAQEMKLYTSAGNDRMVRWWKANGYRPVALATTDIMTGLQTGLIEAMPTTPLAALSLQWYRSTPYMLDLGLAPLVGATVVSKRTWSRLSDADQKALRTAARGVQKRLEESVPEQDRLAVEQMVSRGLTLTRPETPEEVSAWQQQARRFSESMSREVVPEEIYRLALTARDEFRAQE